MSEGLAKFGNTARGVELRKFVNKTLYDIAEMIMKGINKNE